MKITQRFENAVSKLYNAFHENRLNSNDPCACAVGNMCDNDRGWSLLVSRYGSGKLTHNNVNLEYGKSVTDKTGYSPLEIVTIENIFLKNADWEKNCTHEYIETKEQQFKGLCAVVEYLCELDGIPNIMDYTSLFETVENKPKKELVTVFNH